YYKLTWKGECLLHPENTRIVVLFTTTFIALLVGIAQFMQYVKGTVTTLGHNILTVENGAILAEGSDAMKFVALDRSEVASIHLPSGAPDLLSTLMEKKSLAYNFWSSSSSKNFSLTGISNEGTDTLSKNTHVLADKSEGISQAIYQDPTLLYIAIACFVVFAIVLGISLWRIWENKTQKV
ncbi:MAG: hypothetical protein NTV74_07765, partial [Euryarchaeota archaeon]|nr:hypothetical protein [Euryarchaeota archaeon]